MLSGYNTICLPLLNKLIPVQHLSANILPKAPAVTKHLAKVTITTHVS